LLPNKTYDDLDMGFQHLKIWSADSPVTEYVQHPIPIPAPWDKNAVALKPLKLTTKVRLRHCSFQPADSLHLCAGGEKDSSESPKG
jgi:hypothetical protein